MDCSTDMKNGLKEAKRLLGIGPKHKLDGTLDNVRKLSKADEYISNDIFVAGPDSLSKIKHSNNIGQVYYPKNPNKIDSSIDYNKYKETIENFVDSGIFNSGGIGKLKSNIGTNFDGVMYRGLNIKLDSKGLKYLDSIENLKPGTIISNSSDSSYSIDFKSAKKFASNPMYYDGPPGIANNTKGILFTARGKGYYIAKQSPIAYEEEVIIGSGAKFKVLNVFNGDNQIHVLLEQIPTNVSTNVDTKYTDMFSLLGVGVIGSTQLEE